MRQDTVNYLRMIAEKDHWERADQIAMNEYLEKVQQNAREMAIAKEKNAIEKLANNQLNTREMIRINEIIANDAAQLLEKEKSRLSNEEIEAAKRVIERYNAETERLRVENEKNHTSNEPTYEKERNDATIKAGLYRGIGGLGGALGALLVKSAMSIKEKGAAGNSLEVLLSKITKTSAKGASNNLKDIVFTALGNPANAYALGTGIGIVGAAKILYDSNKFMDSDEGKKWVAKYESLHRNVSMPSNAKRIRKDEIEEEDEIPNDIGHRSQEEAQQTYFKNNYKGGNVNEGLSQQTQSNEVSADRNPTNQGSNNEARNAQNDQSNSSTGSAIIWSPGAARGRSLGPGFS